MQLNTQRTTIAYLLGCLKLTDFTKNWRESSGTGILIHYQQKRNHFGRQFGGSLKK